MFTSYAQNFEDVMLWRALKNVEHGFYVDIGAQDPIVDSVSLAFYEQGWRGVHIEPVPAYANLLRAHRPDEVVIQALIGSTTNVLPFFEFPETGLSTTSLHIASRHREAGFESRETLVPCLTLKEALAPFAGREIHWLKIDVEGSERQVLEGWGTEIKPWVVVIESTLPLSQIESHHPWEQLILELGYSFAFFDGVNRYFISSEHAELLHAFRHGPTFFDGFVLSSTTPFCANLNAKIEEHLQTNQMLQAEIGEREIQANEALRALEQRKTQIEALECEVTNLSRHNDVLYESMAIARQHSAGMESQLSGARERIRVLEHNIAEADIRMDAQTRELLSSGERYRGLESEWNIAIVKIADLEVQRDHWQALADRSHRDLQTLCTSRSWRVTAPLRRANVVVKASMRMIKLGISILVGLPRRVVERGARAVLAYLEVRPERKARIARFLARFPRLHERLTILAWAHRHPQSTVVLTTESRELGKEEITWEAYPLSVRETYAKLIEARARAHANVRYQL